MNYHQLCFVFISLLIMGISVIQIEGNNRIPEYLTNCYKFRPPPVLPQTMDTFIDIIRKIEISPYFRLDIKTFTNVLLHKFRIDGIEKEPVLDYSVPGVIPYKISGFQTHKLQILYDNFISNNNFDALNPIDKILSEVEKCNLHWMLSSSVDFWERGDERYACTSSIQGFISPPLHEFGMKMSSCPQEKGVIYHEHGTINIGSVIAGLATGFIQQSPFYGSTWSSQFNTSSTSSISGHNNLKNIFAATIAGDLAEVINFQAAEVDKIHLGPASTWNDSYIPTASYFMNLDNKRIEKKSWEITDAEIFGGVDGILLGINIPILLNQVKNIRLSQILEMYYSNKGIILNGNLKACNREINAFNLINTEKQALLDQVVKLAIVIAESVPNVLVDGNFIEQASRKTVDSFVPYFYNLLSRIKCKDRIDHSEKINLRLIIDQTWPSYNILQIIMFLSRAANVNYYGSDITVINGQTGNIILNRTRNTSQIFQQWISADTELIDLNLPQALLALKSLIDNEIAISKHISKLDSYGSITIILGYSSTISDADHKQVKDILSTLKSADPGTKFIYVTSSLNNLKFVQFTSIPGSQNDKIITLYNNDIHRISTRLKEPLTLVSRNLIPSYCVKDKLTSSNSIYEEYVISGQPIKYRIHPVYLCGSTNLIVKVKNFNNGHLRVCTSRDEATIGYLSCNTIKVYENHEIRINNPCLMTRKQEQEANSKQQWLEDCKPIFIDISAESTFNTCSDARCRFPDQVNFNIILQGLHCVHPYKTRCSFSPKFPPNSQLICIAILFIFITIKILYIS